MKQGIAVTSVVLVLFMITSGCGKQALQPGDAIVPPIAVIDSENGKSNGSTTSLNNFSNYSPLAQPSSDMIYTMLNRDSAPLSIFADNKYLYLLRDSKNITEAVTNSSYVMNRYANRVEVYDVENGSLVRKIDDARVGSCSAFTVRDSNIYTYDALTGRISLFSSSGSFLSAYETGLENTYVQKLAIAGNGYAVLKIQASMEGASEIAVFNPDTKEVRSFTQSQLYMSSESDSPKINDFCLYDSKSILVGISNGFLSLFNLETEQPVKTCIFPMAAGFMEFDGNVLYYASDLPLSLTPLNQANFSNTTGARYTSRLLINSEFPWPLTEQELGQWQLGNIKMPSAVQDRRHYGMSKNTKYLFFMDFTTVSGKESKAVDLKKGFTVYRVMK